MEISLPLQLNLRCFKKNVYDNLSGWGKIIVLKVNEMISS